MTVNTTPDANHAFEMDETFTTSKRFSGLVPTEAEVLDVTSLGRGVVLEQERKVDLTEKLSREMLEHPKFIGERPLRDGHVTYLNRCMKQGTFRPELVRLMTCVCEEKVDDYPGGTEFRMNGQHTSWARIYMPSEYECPGKVVLAKYRAKTSEDMRLLYATIDRGTPRTKSNVITAHLAGTNQFKSLKPTDIKTMSDGFSFYKWDNSSERKRHDGDEIAFLMQGEDANLVNTVVAYLSTFSISSVDWMRRSPVIGAMFTTFEKVVKPSADFWDSVREGTGMASKNDPRLKLRNQLMTCKLSIDSSKGKRSQSKSVEPEKMFRWSIQAWNAWRRDEPLTSFKAILTAERPKAR